jgi:hypothetical protein
MFEEVYLTMFVVCMVGAAIAAVIYLVAKGYLNHVASTCQVCKRPIQPTDITVTRQVRGEILKLGFCRECFQKELDKQGNCPYCNERLMAGQALHTPPNESVWFHSSCYNERLRKEQLSATGPYISSKEVIKEVIVKVRCSYCGNTYDEVLDICPHCGGRKRA